MKFTDGKGRAAGYVPPNAPDNRMIISNQPIEGQIGTLVHEAVHILDDKKKFNISNSQQYIKACMSDSKKLRKKGGDVHVSPSTQEFADKVKSYDEDAIRRPLSEDFATSVVEYLKDPKKFSNNYPARADIIESVLKGNFNPIESQYSVEEIIRGVF